jgi:hypothetical protein
MKKISALLILIYCSANVSGQLPYLWVDSVSSSPYAGSYSSELKVDADGNVYTFAFGDDTAIVKYNPGGELLWSAPYADTLLSVLECIEFANDGSIYVVGGGNAHIVAMKYSETGNLVWIRYYFHNSGSQFYSTHAAVGLNDELVIATSETNSGGASKNIIIVKYDSSGNQLWNYISPSTGLDEVFALTLDGNEDVITTGVAHYHFNPVYDFTGGDVFLMKVSAAGVLSWLSFYDAPDSSYDQGTCVVCDDENNYYVTGWSKPLDPAGSGNSSLLVLKFDVNGSLIWDDSILNGVQNQNCGDKSLCLVNNRLVFAGAYVDSSGQQFLNASYDLSSNFLWQNVFASPYGYSQSECHRSILTKTKTVLNLADEYNWDASFPKSTLFEIDTFGNVINAWKLDSLNAFHQEFDNLLQAETGEYYLRGYINDGGFSTKIVTAKIEDITTGIQSVISGSSLTIIPNPSSSSIILSGLQMHSGKIVITITDLAGNKKLQVNLENGNQQIDISALASGMYVLLAKDRVTSAVGKLSIIH